VSAEPAARRGGLVDRAVRAVLAHPLVRVVRGRIEEAHWRRRGRGERNPLLPARPFTVVFVCHGNICRSPFAARLFEREVARRGLDGVTTLSAGYGASPAARCPEHAIAAAADYGIDLATHTPTPLDPAMLDAVDLVVVMEVAHRPLLAGRFGEPRPVILLPLYAGADRGAYARVNIRDPYGRPRETFDACYRQIEDAVGGFLDAIAAPARPA
jgi:low molecular weight protein-tyrosine phosphatase